MTSRNELAAEARAARRDPLFLAVLALKIAAGACFASQYFLVDRFLPFVSYFVDSRFSDPWTEFLRRGVLDAFPYSTTMLLSLAIPTAPFAWLFGGAAALPRALALLLLRVPMLAADAAIYLILCGWFPNRRRAVLLLYWCSPVLFYISYVHGQIDSIPTAFLFASLAAASSASPLWAGLLLGLGISAKFHLAAVVPLVAFYLYKNSAPSARLKTVVRYVAALALAVAVLVGPPFLFSEGYRALVLHAKEMTWVYDYSLATPNGARLLLCPAVLLGLLLHFFSYNRISRDLLVLYIGLLYTTLIVLVTPMPGWSYWCVPFLCYFLIRQDVPEYLPFWIYTAAYLVYFIAFAPRVAVLNLTGGSWLGGRWDPRDVSFTAMQTSLALVAVWMYRNGVKIYASYRALRACVAVGIGGDSGSGKHSLARALTLVVGEGNAARLHGDDYHRWERGHEAWRSMTHLHPRANYLRQPVEDIGRLKEGHPIERSRYDHDTGAFGDPERVEPSGFILFEGLHPFLSPRLRDALDIKIFLDTDEALRRFWKVRRDARERGHKTEHVVREIDRREGDSSRFVRPQVRFADWVITYAPLGTLDADAPDEAEVKASHTVSTAYVEMEDLVDLLSSLEKDGLHVGWSMSANLSRQTIEVDGKLGAERVREFAYRLVPDLEDLFKGSPTWLPDLQGVNQLIFLVIASGRLKR
ncbi:MAG: hypothetical protein ACHQ49_07410 [Elusimicrobiota bacterium]